MHSTGAKFICSGENILHHHTTEVAALPEQTSKYSNENLVRTPNQQYIHFFFFFRYPSLLEDILEFQDRMAYQEGREGAEGEGPRGITGRRGERKEIKGHVVIMVHLE